MCIRDSRTTERFFLLNPDRKRIIFTTPKGALFIRRRSEEKTYRRGGRATLVKQGLAKPYAR